LVKVKHSAPDYTFFSIIVVLVVLGVLAVFDASYARAAESRMTGNDMWYFAKRQFGFAIVGMICMFGTMHISLDTFRKCANALLYISILLLGAVLVPGIGKTVNGAARWLPIVGSLTFQPSELAKMAVVLYLARELSRQGSGIRNFKSGVLRHLVWVAVIAFLLIKEPDMGTMMVVVGTTFAMLYVGGISAAHLAGISAAGVFMVMLLIKIEPYRMTRLMTFLDPWKDYYGAGYQIIHSLIALGTGGIFGIGLCEGREKMYIPEPHTDMIYSTIGEEAGLIGALIVMALFAFLAYRGINIALRSKSSYTKLLAAGMTSMITLQALVNVAVVSASIPATGVPLPFISYGGSSLLFTMMAAGVILSVSRQLNNATEEDNNETSGYRRGNRRSHISGSQRGRSGSRRDTRSRSAVYR
jgi:cell division protein FtsW